MSLWIIHGVAIDPLPVPFLVVRASQHCLGMINARKACQDIAAISCAALGLQTQKNTAEFAVNSSCNRRTAGRRFGSCGKRAQSGQF